MDGVLANCYHPAGEGEAAMPDILIRDVDPDVLERLKQHAKLRNRSVQAELSEIVAEAARRPTPDEVHALFAECQSRFDGSLLPSSLDMLREDRDR